MVFENINFRLFGLTIPLDSLLEKLLGSPRHPFEEQSSHYSFQIFPENNSFLVHSVHEVFCHVQQERFPVNRWTSEASAKIQEESTQAMVHGDFIPYTMCNYKSAFSEDRTAYFIERTFLKRKEPYQIFTATKYVDFKPFERGQIRSEEGFSPVDVEKYKIRIWPMRHVRELTLELAFYNIHLRKMPVLVQFNPVSEVANSAPEQFSERDPFMRHFFLKLGKLQPNKPYEISWEIPLFTRDSAKIFHADPGLLAHTGFWSDGKRPELFEPGSEHKSTHLLREIFASAKYRLVLFDPYIAESIAELLRGVSGNVDVCLVTQSGRTEFIDRSKLSENLSGKNCTLDVKLSGRHHDRWIIVDDIQLFFCGPSMDGMGHKYGAIFPINSSEPHSERFIRVLYKSVGINPRESKV